MQWMSLHNTSLPAPLCIQCTSQPLLALDREINIKLRILFNGEISRLSLPPSSICSSGPKMKASSRSCLLCLALVRVWWGQGYMQSGVLLLTLTSHSRKQMCPKWAECRSLWLGCVMTPGWNPALFIMWKTLLMSEGPEGAQGSPVKTWGPQLFCNLKMPKVVFCHWSWLALSGDTQSPQLLASGTECSQAWAQKLPRRVLTCLSWVLPKGSPCRQMVGKQCRQPSCITQLCTGVSVAWPKLKF